MKVLRARSQSAAMSVAAVAALWALIYAFFAWGLSSWLSPIRLAWWLPGGLLRIFCGTTITRLPAWFRAFVVLFWAFIVALHCLFLATRRWIWFVGLALLALAASVGTVFFLVLGTPIP